MYVTKSSGIYRLIISDSDGFNEQVILKSNKSIISPAWSHDAENIAYVSFENNRLKFCSKLSKRQRDLVLSSRSSVSAPAWSPDNKYLALTSTMDGNSEIYLVEIKNKKLPDLHLIWQLIQNLLGLLTEKI